MGLTKTRFIHRASAVAVMKRYIEATGWDNLTIKVIPVKLDSGLMGVRYIIVRKDDDNYETR